MKKGAFIIVLAALFMAVSALSFGQESSETKGPMVGKGMKMRGPMKDMGRKCGMMKMMHEQMVATGDGGIIVMAGNRLMKYDRDLNLVREVEIKMEMEDMPKKTMQKKEMWPMRGSMPEGGPAEEN